MKATTPTTIPAAEAKVAMVQCRVREWRAKLRKARALLLRLRKAAGVQPEVQQPGVAGQGPVVAAANRSRRDDFTASLPGGGKPFHCGRCTEPPPLMPGERRMPELDALFL